MRFAGIEIASEKHVVTIVNADGTVEVKATGFTEDAAGYEKVLALLGASSELPIAMEATGDYWKNLFAVLAAAGHAVALLNPIAHPPLRRRRPRANQDRRPRCSGHRPLRSEKWPAVTPLPDALAEELRELLHLRDRLLQDFGDRIRQLHRLVDLGFPEFTRYVRTLNTVLDGLTANGSKRGLFSALLQPRKW